MNCVRYGSRGLALLEACSMIFGHSFDMCLRGRNGFLDYFKKFEDFVQTLKKFRSRCSHLYEALTTTQECFCFHDCEANCRIESGHFYVIECGCLGLKRLQVAGELLYCFGRFFVPIVFQSLELTLRVYPLNIRGTRVRGIYHLRRFRFIDDPITFRNLAIDVGQPVYEFCEAAMEHTRVASDLSNDVIRRHDLEGSFHHRVDLATAMGPERNRDGCEGGGETRKRRDPFTLSANDLRVRPCLPTSHRNARYCAGSSHSHDKNFNTAELSHATSAGVDRESYSIVKDVSA